MLNESVLSSTSRNDCRRLPRPKTDCPCLLYHGSMQSFPLESPIYSVAVNQLGHKKCHLFSRQISCYATLDDMSLFLSHQFNAFGFWMCQHCLCTKSFCLCMYGTMECLCCCRWASSLISFLLSLCQNGEQSGKAIFISICFFSLVFNAFTHHHSSFLAYFELVGLVLYVHCIVGNENSLAVTDKRTMKSIFK